MNLTIEKLRIPLSRIAVAAGFFILCGTTSYWDNKNQIVSSLLFFLGVILVAIASLGRMWCSLYIAGYKNEKLITQGPYSLCRNPLYFFSMIGVVGIGCATETFLFPLVFIIMFSIYYPLVIKSEEKNLKIYFGEAFDDYMRKTPAFFPKISSFEEPKLYTVNPIVYRRHIFSALWFVWIVGILEFIEELRGLGFSFNLWTSY